MRRLTTDRLTISSAVPRRCSAGLLAFVTLLSVPAVAAPTPVPMAADGWHATPPVPWVSGHDGRPATIHFSRDEGFPDGAMTIDAGIAVSDRAHFADGTIDFDERPIGYDDAGIVFRRQGAEAGEFLYLRANPDCPAAIDCIQYAPIVRGGMDWDIYPDHQGPAPISSTGWNHIRIVAVGGRMLVFVNHSVEPTLVVPRLQGSTAAGGIAFKGPASYANLVLDPALPARVAAQLTAVPAPAPGLDAILDWQATVPAPFPNDRSVTASQIPAAAALWRPIAAEPDGLVNIGRVFGGPGDTAPQLAWLRATIDVPVAGRHVLRLGFARQLTAFLDGERIYVGDNPYYPTERRLSPGGRLSPDNATLPVDLTAGRHELVLAVGNGWPRRSDNSTVATYYGWAAEAHLDSTHQP